MKSLKGLMTKTLSIIAISIIAVVYLALPALAVSYSYDSLNRLTRVVYQPGQEISYSYDNSGNILNITAIGFDDIPPVTSIKLEGQAGQQDWFRSDVQVILTAADNKDGTGVVKTEYSYDQKEWITYSQTITITTEGLTDLYYRSCDATGNLEAVQKTTVKIDKTAPAIEVATSTPATTFGWHNSDVTVHFTGSDALSGVAQITPDTTLTLEGAGQIVEGTVTDLAGNTAQTSITVNIDKTPPVITAAVTGQPNAAGWYKEDVTIKFAASDALSGIDTVTPDTVVSTEGANQSITGTVVDKAGNTTSVTLNGINLDKTAPNTTCTPDKEPNQNGWHKNDVQLTLSAADKEGGSGVVKTEYSFDGNNWTTYDTPITISTEGITDIYYRSADLADNIESSNKLTVKLDKTPPVITGAPTTEPNQNGWWNSDVTVHFVAEDPISGIETLTPDTIVSAEGANQSVIGTAVDKAGNTASFSVEKINLDKTKPEINITSPIEGREYILNEETFAGWTATDSVSGIETAAGTVPDGSNIDTASVGEKTFTVTTTDLAGNQETKTVSYYVHYNYIGLLEPIQGGKVFKGNTIPVKFSLTDAQGSPAPNAIARLYLTGADGIEIEAVSTSNATEGNLFRFTDTEYMFNLNTQDLQPGTWQLKITLDDGTTRFGTVELGENGGPPEDKPGKEKDKDKGKDKDQPNQQNTEQEEQNLIELTSEQPQAITNPGAEGASPEPQGSDDQEDITVPGANGTPADPPAPPEPVNGLEGGDPGNPENEGAPEQQETSNPDNPDPVLDNQATTLP